MRDGVGCLMCCSNVPAAIAYERCVTDPSMLPVDRRYCAPTNRASRLSPEGFSQYLREPWYAILTEWDAIQARLLSGMRSKRAGLERRRCSAAVCSGSERWRFSAAPSEHALTPYYVRRWPPALQLEEEAEPITRDGTVVQQEVLVRRASDESWTIVNWQV